MPLLAADALVQELRKTNSRLGFWLGTLLPDGTQPFAQARPATPQQMAGLLSELMRAGVWLRGLPCERGPELEQELSDYRKNVERLRQLLPAIHSILLAERARLERERARVESAAEWARRSHQTL